MEDQEERLQVLCSSLWKTRHRALRRHLPYETQLQRNADEYAAP